MGNKNLDIRTDEKESSYQVIAFRGTELPGQYLNMVLSKWMRSLKHGNEYFKLIHSDSFFKAYDRYIKSILLRPDTTVRVAVLSDDRDVALGWSVIENSTLHYVHVQADQRNKGIGKSLVPRGIQQFSHLTKTGLAIWAEALPHAIFNPFC